MILGNVLTASLVSQTVQDGYQLYELVLPSQVPKYKRRFSYLCIGFEQRVSKGNLAILA